MSFGLQYNPTEENLARIPVEVDIASEFRYRKPIIDDSTLTIVVSQSGETIDTLAALKEAKRLGSKTMAVTNVVGSSIAREADQVVYTCAGPEIAVASTKAYTTQLIVMFLLGAYMAGLRETVDTERMTQLLTQLKNTPSQISETLEDVEPIMAFAQQYGYTNDAFFLGRALDYYVALEGSLKLKEVSYIHSEAYASGELKHGPIALVDKNTLVVAIATDPELYEKIASNIVEVRTRGATTFVITQDKDGAFAQAADEIVSIPHTESALASMLSIIPAQLFAYYCAIHRGTDPDKPRNLAKSVTVE